MFSSFISPLFQSFLAISSLQEFVCFIDKFDQFALGDFKFISYFDKFYSFIQTSFMGALFYYIFFFSSFCLFASWRLSMQTFPIKITPNMPITKQNKANQRRHYGTLPAITYSQVVPMQQPSIGGNFLGLRKLQENKPKTTEPRPVPVRTTPLTYIFLPGKYLLHQTIGTIKLSPEASPNNAAQSTMKAPIDVTQLQQKISKAWQVTTDPITSNGCVCSLTNRPNLIVTPMVSIMMGKAMALFSNVAVLSCALKQDVMYKLIIPHWYRDPITK